MADSAATAAGSTNSNAISSLPPNAAGASKAALDTAMTEVSNGAAPGSSIRARSGSQSAQAGEAGAEGAGAAEANGAAEPSSATTSSSGGASGDAAKESIFNGKGNADEMRTVFEDPENFNVKHPLANRWTLWFDNPSQKGMPNARGTKDTWGDDLNKVVDVDSVEEFWGLYHNIIPPSQLPSRANYYLFKENIQPMWEDEANAKGGKWSVQFPREKSKNSIDTLWLYTMLSAIGETLDAPYPSGSPHPQEPTDKELITGVLLAARPNFYRIAIWTRQADTVSEEVTKRLMDIGRHFKVNVLGYGLDEKLSANYGTDVEYQSHSESEKKKGKKTVL